MSRRTNLKMFLVMAVFLAGLAPAAATGRTIYVDANTPDNNDGSSWAQAYKYLQDGLAGASSGDEIWVALGTYWPDTNNADPNGSDDRDATFTLINGVGIYGGFAPGGTWIDRDPNVYETILSGDINDIGDQNDNSYHVVTGSSVGLSAIIDGFTITAGNANGESPPDDCGGGMYNDDSSPTLINCTFSDNTAAGFGGGMYNSGGSPTITDCIFISNSVLGDLGSGGPYSGGGMYNDQSDPNLTDCTFIQNRVEGYQCYGGGMSNNQSSPTLVGCTFTSNSVEGYLSHGGGIDGFESHPTLTDCTFTANSADYTGGGMHNEDGSPTLTDCTFNSNTSDSSGGGMCNDSWHDRAAGNVATLTGCTFSGNTSPSAGGGMYNTYCDSILIDCTFENNTTVSGGGMVNGYGCSTTITRCTFRENSATRGSAGGFYNMSGSDATVIGCIFTGNSAYYDGCGMYNQGTATVINCTFSGNSGHLYTHSGGGGIADHYGASLTVVNSIFSGNSAGFGGGMFNRRSNSVTVVNCTFTGNSATWEEDGGGIYNRNCNPVIANCIIGANIGDEIYNYLTTADPNVTYSCIEGGYPGAGNIGSYPLFAGSGLRLAAGSPCIDAGDNDALPPDTLDVDNDGDTTEPIPLDLAFNIRRKDDPAVDPDPGNPGTLGPPVVDMGAYELSPLFVDDNASSGGDGGSWATAFKYLQDALYAAADPSWGTSEIRVARGTYYPDQDEGSHVTPGDREATFQMQSALAIRGGYRGPTGGGDPDDHDPNAFETILSGDMAGNDGPDFENNQENSYHIVTSSDTDDTAVLDGFTIIAGNADFSSGHNDGGGMWNNNSSPTVSNCIFVGNSAVAHGGGMENYNSSSPTVAGCTFSGNSAYYGGGMFNRQSSPTVTSCTFTGNSATYGGGIGTLEGVPTVKSCMFIGNSAYYSGGGMWNWEFSSSPTVTGCTFTGNSANIWGGGMSNWDFSSPTLTNCILWGNSDCNGVDESAQIHNEGDSDTIISYSCIQGCSTYCSDPADRNIGNNPLFVRDPNDGGDGWGDDPCTPGVDESLNDDYGDLRLTAGSPCVDTGNNDADTDANTPEIDPLPDTDLDGRPRLADGDCNSTDIVDMGAYEFTYAYIGDFDADCDVDFVDYAILANYWLADELLVDIAPTPAGDGIIDERDLGILCDNWLFGK